MNEFQEFLIDVPVVPVVTPQRFRQIAYPIWTENKSNLIANYLKYFVQITYHGTYIDGFAGPQKKTRTNMWSAKKVLEQKPRWLRHFFLFELAPKSVAMLEKLRDSQPPRQKNEPKRRILILPGDFNANVKKMLADYPIKPKEATFCLLDQRTFECDWETVELLAKHKTSGNKIELFYFFPDGWLARSMKGIKNGKDARLNKWWGRDDWGELLKRKSFERAMLVCERFKKELGYKYVYPFPIFGRKDGGRTMYYMIHASDHPDATKLMLRAYANAVGLTEVRQQDDWLRDYKFDLKPKGSQ